MAYKFNLIFKKSNEKIKKNQKYWDLIILVTQFVTLSKSLHFALYFPICVNSSLKPS